MRKWLLITTALVAFAAAPSEVRADPITGALISVGFSSTVATALVQIGTSILLSAVSQKLAGKPKVEAQRAELAQPTSLPPYRYVYGSCWAPGTPVAWHVVNYTLYICYLLNSRPSALTSHQLLFDKRETTIEGDPFDFDGPGAQVVNEPFRTGQWDHARYWIGRGDQTTCPAAIVSGAGGHFLATDAWQGCTVLWAELDAGGQDERQERWPSTPPEVNVEGDWSLVHDPRTDTTSATSNQALIVRDALLQNPIRSYSPEYLWDETFEWAADVAEQQVPVKGGGTILRYRADGVLVWADGAELEDQIEPLLAAGGSRLIRVGGRLGIVPAIHRTAVHTISDVTDGQPIQMTRWQPSDQIYTECVATYTAPDRAYEAAEAPAYVVAGAQAEDGGLAKRLDLSLDFVTDHRQAQRLAKIAVMRSRMQRQVSAELFPDAFKLVAGSVVTLDLPAPYTPWNGLYEVESIHPAAGINDDESMTLRLPVTIRETSAAIYAWSAAAEEQTVEASTFNPSVGKVLAPASLTLTSGGAAALIPVTGAATPRVELTWPASVSSSAVRYEWQYQVEVEGGAGAEWSPWTTGGIVEITGEASQRAWISPVTIGSTYRARVRTMGRYGNSVWRVRGSITASGPSRSVGMPVILMATGGAGQIDLTMRQASDAQATQLEIWAASANDLGLAALLATVPAGANVTVSRSEAGLGSAQTRYYWLRARDALGNASPYTASATATTAP